MARDLRLITDEQWKIIEPLLPEPKAAPNGEAKPKLNPLYVESILRTARTAPRLLNPAFWCPTAVQSILRTARTAPAAATPPPGRRLSYRLDQFLGSRPASYTVSSRNNWYAIVSSLRAGATVVVSLPRQYATRLNRFRNAAVGRLVQAATRCAIRTQTPGTPPGPGG